MWAGIRIRSPWRRFLEAFNLCHLCQVDRNDYRMFQVVDPDPSQVRLRLRILLSSRKIVRNLAFFCFVIVLWSFIFEKWCKCTFKKQWAEKLRIKNNFLLASWRSGSGAGSIGQRHGSGSVPKCHGSNFAFPWIPGRPAGFPRRPACSMVRIRPSSCSPPPRPQHTGRHVNNMRKRKSADPKLS